MKILVVSYLAMEIAASLLLCSCAGLSVNESFYAKDVPRKVPFNEADFPRNYHSGSGTVYGHDFLTKMNDSTEDASNAEVQLFPVTPYTTEFVQREFAAGTYLAPPDPRYLKYVRTVRADQNGNFRFSNIPAGDYYIGGRVYFMGTSTTTFDDGSTQQFHERCYTWNYNKVTVRNGQSVAVNSWISGPERIKHEK